MAVTRQEVRDYVRGYMDLEVEDLADVLIDRWHNEAVTTINGAHTRWPFREVVRSLTLLEGEDTYDSPVSLVTGIYGGPAGALTRMSAADAQDSFHSLSGEYRTGEPYAWTDWPNGTLKFWPAPDGLYSLSIRGYAVPEVLGSDAGAAADLPPEFDDLILSWVMYRAYLQQDDSELALIQKQAFDEGLTRIKRRVDESPREEPLVFASGNRNPHRRSNLGGPVGPGLGGWGPGWPRQ